jgi:site-specific DNA-methyltransferase (adenine-specific)
MKDFENFRLKSKGAAGIKDVWTFPQSRNTGHPASFPIQLPLNILETVKYKDIVIDPFCGSGTVALACKQTGSNYICFDN